VGIVERCGNTASARILRAADRSTVYTYRDIQPSTICNLIPLALANSRGTYGEIPYLYPQEEAPYRKIYCP
jgi:hypothetical protein